MITEAVARAAADCPNSDVKRFVLVEWAIQEIARREAEQMIRTCPITDESLASHGFSDAGINGHSMLLECKEGSVVEMFIDDHHGVSLAQDETDLVALTSLGKLRDSGQLLDLLAALKGGAS